MGKNFVKTWIGGINTLNLATEKTKKPLTLFERLKACETPSSAAVLLERTSCGGCPPPGNVCRAGNCTDCWLNYLNSPVDMPEKGGGLNSN